MTHLYISICIFIEILSMNVYSTAQTIKKEVRIMDNKINNCVEG